jgi:hypothetical protein
MRQTEQQHLADLEAKHTLRHQTLRTIQVIAETAPPWEAQVALRAIRALATEALAEAEPEAHKHRTSE